MQPTEEGSQASSPSPVPPFSFQELSCRPAEPQQPAWEGKGGWWDQLQERLSPLGKAGIRGQQKSQPPSLAVGRGTEPCPPTEVPPQDRSSRSTSGIGSRQ